MKHLSWIITIAILVVVFVIVNTLTKTSTSVKGVRGIGGIENGYVTSISNNESFPASQGITCPVYPYYDNTHRLSIFVEPTIPLEDNLITYFITGNNPNTSAYFILTAWEVPGDQVQTFQIPVCPDPGGWVLNFRTTYPRFAGNVGYCTYGYNFRRSTYFDTSSGVLLHNYHPPFNNGQASCVKPVGYVTYPWCTGEIRLSGTKTYTYANLSSFENIISTCATQQSLLTTGYYELGAGPVGSYSVSYLTYPIAKFGIPNLSAIKMVHYLSRNPVNGITATINYSINGIHIYTDSIPPGAATKTFNLTGTGPCTFVRN